MILLYYKKKSKWKAHKLTSDQDHTWEPSAQKEIGRPEGRNYKEMNDVLKLKYYN